MAHELEDLTGQVEQQVTLESSAATMLEGIAAKIDSLKQDPAKLAALSVTLKNSAAKLTAAMLINTDQDPDGTGGTGTGGTGTGTGDTGTGETGDTGTVSAALRGNADTTGTGRGNVPTGGAAAPASANAPIPANPANLPKSKGGIL